MIATYLHGARGPEYRRNDSTDAVRWYLYDGLGSVLGEVDANGNITASRKHDVYGGVRASTGTGTSNHKFVGSLGHPSEDGTELIYMRAGYCDPVVGRFISQDPAGDGVNWYIYAGDSPTSAVDRDGRSKMSLQKQLAYAFGVACTIAALWLALIAGLEGTKSLLGKSHLVAAVAAATQATMAFGYSVAGLLSSELDEAIALRSWVLGTIEIICGIMEAASKFSSLPAMTVCVGAACVQALQVTACLAAI